MTETYSCHWTCKKCGQENSFERTKIEAAFNHSPKVPPCSNCGGTDIKSMGSALPDIDEELLEMWFSNPDLLFLDQDEDLIISGANLDVFKSFLAAKNETKARARAMGPILAVKLYDDSFNTPEECHWCIGWLANNRDKWAKYTAGYVTKIINPILKNQSTEMKSK